MKIAITGSTGLVGTALVQHLQAAGHEIVHLVRRVDRAIDAAHCWWNPAQGVQQLDKLEGCHVCVHLAGRSLAQRRWNRREKTLIVQSRVPATERLCASLRQLARPLELFVSASAVGIYGDCGSNVVTEELYTGGQWPELTSHSVDQLADLRDVEFLKQLGQCWESAAATLQSSGTPVICVRLGIVLSESGGALAKMLPLFRWGLGGNLGHGQQYWSWIALKDVVRAIDWCIQRRACFDRQARQQAQPVAYNLVAPQPVTNAEFTLKLARCLGRTRFLPAPSLALRLAVGEFADAALLSSCRAVPARLSNEGFEFEYPELERALASLLHHGSSSIG